MGKKAAEQLGIPCYDAELIQKLAEESGFSEGYVKEAGEYVPHGFLSFAFPTAPRGRPTRMSCGTCNIR
ncbi:MAG: cytidylate kinase family protein [Oscillospiraceae bacterium]|nr:cytidylate kinase family protein [Oscillospiraceae bacterium]